MGQRLRTHSWICVYLHIVGTVQAVGVSFTHNAEPATMLWKGSEGEIVEAKQADQEWVAQLSKPEALESCRPKRSGAKVVLVTGTAGFIGHHTALKLAQRGDGVLGYDNFNSYYPVELKQARAKDLKDRGQVVTVKADLNDLKALKAVFALCNFSHVLHLAAQAGVRYAVKNPQSYAKSNVEGFINMLEAVKSQKPIPRVVYASSSSVYGTNTKVPFSEIDPVNSPASLYAATKRENELLAHTYNHIYDMALTGLRFFTVYGPYGRPDMAAFSFANKITLGQPVKIFTGPGGSELERDFTYVEDIVDGCIAAVDNIGPSSKPAPLKVYNLGNENPENVSYLVSLLEESLGKKAVRDYQPLDKTGDVLRTHADVNLARKELGYSPKISLKEGISRFVQWYKGYYPGGHLSNAMMLYEGVPAASFLEMDSRESDGFAPGMPGYVSDAAGIEN